jgi:hypothetical protein
MNYLQDQAVMNFAGTAARGSAIGTAVSEGMVSYLADSNAVEVYDGSDWKQVYPAVDVPTAGQIVQVQSTFKSNVFSTSSTSYVDVTDLSVSITPKSTANNILVLVSFMYGNNDVNQAAQFNLLRNSTNIAQSTGGSASNQTVAPFTNSLNIGHMISLVFLDSPATTSATTYKIQGRANAGTIYVGRYGVNDQRPTVSTITVMEVVA